MTNESKTEKVMALAGEIESELYRQFGPLMFGKALHSALGFPSGDAFRQALCRKTVPVETFVISNRRGRFALSKDIALWLAQQRLSNEEDETTQDK